MKKTIVAILMILMVFTAGAQFVTREDSVNNGLNPSNNKLILSGYGEVKFSYDRNFKTATVNLTRNVLFVGYRFNSTITLFTELEVEDAKVDPEGGEISLEQAALKFDFGRNNYILAGLFIPRIGIMNENHIPTTFYSNDRPAVEELIIPSTWRELGAGYFGSSTRIQGLNWSLAIVNGLNAEGISGATGIREARFEGRNATASNIALTGALLYYISDYRFQISGYYGGSVGLTPRSADSLGLDSGPFGTPVSLGEFDIQYHKNGFEFRGLGTYSLIPDAEKLNTAYASNAARSMYGYYAEAGYNLLEHSRWPDKSLTAFFRYEKLDLINEVPENGIDDELYDQQYLTAGLTLAPVRGVALKFDWKHVITGQPNPALVFNPSPNAPPYLNVNNFIQAGIAYSF